MMNLRNTVLTLLCLVSLGAFAQRNEKPKNYRKFDEKQLHFGFMLGVNTADFSMTPKTNLLQDYDLLYVQNRKQPGFQLGIITSLKLGHPTLRLRFIPSLSFQERLLTYKFRDPADSTLFLPEETERVESTNLDFPLLLKYRTLRYNNFAAYLVGGAQYTLDLQTKANSSQSIKDPFIKINQHDFQGQIGAGVDFFLPYFKFGLELKMSHSFGNVLIQDNTYISDPIDRLQNRVWWFSITFEG
ncbi:porin family protein [Lishizhenia sp.]|uniref:type IX secretion/gliding motility protein PorT/SprT n=1 Tax=Lishizhenia sp. TaxID=2497594 RepID=UPI00299DD35B|nr:porin family protein [Lishizhenia sp.]MDX1445827.1 porin family protein [Lishizhenia sp.]